MFCCLSQTTRMERPCFSRIFFFSISFLNTLGLYAQTFIFVRGYCFSRVFVKTVDFLPLKQTKVTTGSDVQLYSWRYLCSIPDFLSARKHVAWPSFLFSFRSTCLTGIRQWNWSFPLLLLRMWSFVRERGDRAPQIFA